MKFLTYRKGASAPRAGLLSEDGGSVIDLTALLGAEPPIPDIGALLMAYDDPKVAVETALAEREGALAPMSMPLETLQLCAPILRPPTLRDASCFERHVVNSGNNNGVGTPENWYRAPLFYFQNTNCVTGPEDTVFRKKGSTTLDYEAEIALVIGRCGMDLSGEQAMEYIFGLTIFNDWSDRARCNFEVGFIGLHKGKDTAAGFGPYIVTMDEFADVIQDGKLALKVDAWVDDVHTTDSMTDDMYWTLPQLLAYVSEDTELVPGDIIGLGTVGTGCIYERPNLFPYLADNVTVTIRVQRIGTLRQYVGQRPEV